MKISVIVPTYNRPDALFLCLKSLALQSRLPDEVLIADDGSTSPTQDTVKRFITSDECLFPVKHIWQEDCGFRKPEILNEAVRNATGEYLAFIDGDCMAHRDFINEHIEASEAGAILGGRRVELGQHLTKRLLESNKTLTSLNCKLLIDSLYNGSRKAEEAIKLKSPWLRRIFKRDFITNDGIWGCNFSLYKKLFYEINGCDEDFIDGSVEDNDLGIRVINSGGKIKSVRNLAMVFHLWHKPSWGAGNEKHQKNMQILKNRIALQQSRCENGILKPL